MTCFYRKGTMTESTTTHFAELDNCCVIIKNVPCMKCNQCGEVIYTAAVAQRIEQIIGSLEKALPEIAVVNYSAA